MLSGSLLIYRLPITAGRSTVICIYYSAADASHESMHNCALNMKMRWNTAFCQEKNCFSFFNPCVIPLFITLNLESRSNVKRGRSEDS